MNATEKEEMLNWLKSEPPSETCRVLSNVRCLSEGVDVPALDAVLFLTPRSSQVDVVQSVGRVMRNAPGKTRGYIILPVVIPTGMDPSEALNDNKTYRVVWQVLQALRSHDDRFDAMVNKLDLIGRDPSKMEVIAITDKVQKKSRRKGDGSKKAGKGQFNLGKASSKKTKEPSPQGELPFEIGEIERAIYAKLVQKVGNRHHWEDWANDIARIAQTHIDRINALLSDPTAKNEREAFQSFAAELRDDLNDSITDSEIVEMLAQHLITKPVFDALFAGYSFVKSNPISTAMQDVLDVLQEQRLEKERDTLESFYESVRLRAEGIESASGKQKIVVELYDKFFRNAFPKMTERLGIVYTPVEVVDFIIHSVNHLLQKEFGQTLGSKGVHILDPFTGTGTFITRLLQSGLISSKELPYKYKHEIHANEIVLLAYYIAAINIEATYHDLVGGEYQPFEGICLTDTFQLYEKEDLISRILVDNSARRVRQKKLDIRVILGNPPYSVGQDSANDDNQNVVYELLDQRIRETYAKSSETRMVRALYDSYIRAIRWASDRVGTSGIVGFVTNAGFIDSNTADGLRKCLVEEFSSIYVFHLRGNQRTSGETSRKEGGKIFGGGSRAPIAISMLVKNPKASEHGKIYFHDIGDYLDREAKLNIISEFASVQGIGEASAWRVVVPNEFADWISARRTDTADLPILGSKGTGRTKEASLFSLHSCGVKSNRDAWVFNFSKKRLTENVERTIAQFNADLEKQRTQDPSGKSGKNFMTMDPKSIAWADDFRRYFAKGMSLVYEERELVKATYRPFTRAWYYGDKHLNWSRYQMPKIFPAHGESNLAIGVSSPSDRVHSLSCLMVGDVPSLHAADSTGAHYFPLRYLSVETDTSGQHRLFVEGSGGPGYSAGIGVDSLSDFAKKFPGDNIQAEDLFFYVYGILHAEDYRSAFRENFKKELPRIPCVKSAEDFWAFSKAGRALGDLHVKYDDVPMYEATIETSSKGHGALPSSAYRVEKMRHGKKKVDGKNVPDKSVLIYNEHITVRDIPLEAYEYVVNGKSALDWVVERQCVKTDKDSGIVNDANDWATETMGNPKYPLELFLRVITVSLETMKIVKALPKLELP